MANGPRAVVVGQPPGHRAGDEEAHRERQHVDARPQRCVGEAVAVLGQPDALQPDDEHEHEPAARESGEQRGEVAAGEGADPEQGDAEHRSCHAPLDGHEQREHRDPAQERGEDPGIGPAHRVPAVGQDPVGDADEHRDEADGEGDVAEPVDLGLGAMAAVLELEVGPHGPEQADRHGDEKHEPPGHRGEHAAEHEAEERPGDGGDHVDAEGEATLLGREGVGQDGRGVGEQERGPDALHDAHADQPQGAARCRS